MRGKCNDNEGDIDCTCMLPRVLGYKRGSDIMKGRVYQYVYDLLILISVG